MVYLNSRPESHLRTVILEKIGNVYIWQKIFSNIKHFYSEITLTGSWGLQIVARPDLTSNNSVFTLRPRFASLWWIEVTLTWLMSVFCRVSDLDIHHFLIKYSGAWFPYILISRRSNSIGKERKIKLENFDSRPRGPYFSIIYWTPRERRSVGWTPNANKNSRNRLSINLIVHSSDWLITKW